MSIHRWNALLCVFGPALLLGCQNIPPVPAHAQAAANQAARSGDSDEDEYDGWLYKAMTGQWPPKAKAEAELAANSTAPPYQPPATPAYPPQGQPPGAYPPPSTPYPAPPGAYPPGAYPPSGPAPGYPSAVVPTGYAQSSPMPGQPPLGPVPQSLAPTGSGTVLPPASSYEGGAEQPQDEDDGFDLEDLAPENVFNSAKKALGYGPNEGVARSLYKEGEALFREAEALRQQKKDRAAVAKFEDAAAKFKAASKRAPESPVQEDALFRLGDSYFFSDQYPKAQEAFEKLLEAYDNTRYLDTVSRRLFAIGRYWDQLDEREGSWRLVPNLTDRQRPTLDTWGKAINAYQSIRVSDPTGPLADDAVMATANAYFRRGRFEDAAYHYDLLRKNYPDSQHQAKAHLLALQAKLHSYQGENYDGTPLKEAGKVAVNAHRQFRGELDAEEETRVAEAIQQIREEQAERDWAMADYYERKRAYDSAAFYYQEILKEYPKTQVAQRARKRLAEIKSQSGGDSSRLKWLSDLIPGGQ